jgi:hypothetical protein
MPALDVFVGKMNAAKSDAMRMEVARFMAAKINRSSSACPTLFSANQRPSRWWKSDARFVDNDESIGPRGIEAGGEIEHAGPRIRRVCASAGTA